MRHFQPIRLSESRMNGGEMSKDNLIDLTVRLKQKSKTNTVKSEHKAQVLDMVERRQEAITKERRAIKRTILTEFIGFSIVTENGLCEVSLYDISKSGLSFESPYKVPTINRGDEVAARIYLTQKTYFPFTIKVTNIRIENDEGVHRYGAEFAKEDLKKEALQNFVKFVESVSQQLRADNGDLVTRFSR